jgi:two-component system, cell cycle sensor histidine kinase and response regulator CckA
MSLLGGFIQNAALLLLVAVAVDLVSRRSPTALGRRGQIVLGMVIGALAVVSMLTPVVVEPGARLDTRGILFVMSGLFLGALPTGIAAAMAMAYRLWLGGAYAVVGTAFIVLTAFLGLGWRGLRQRRLLDLHPMEFVVLGTMVAALQLLLAIPQLDAIAWERLRDLVPVLLLASAGLAAFLGWLLQDRLHRAATMQALADRESSFRSLTEQVPAIVYRAALDEQSTTLYISPAISRLGYSVETWMASPDLWVACLHPDDRDATCARLEEQRSADGSVDLVYRFRCADGSYRILHDSAQVIRDTDGTPQYLQGLMVDITEQRAAEARNALQAAALNATADAIAITDRDGVFQWVNPAFSALTLYPAREALGKNPRDLIKSNRQGREFYERMWNTLLAGEVWSGELINRRKDGTEYTEEQTITPVTDAHGEITHFIAIKRDITARRALELQLQQSQRIEAIGRLAGGVAHDFNNLLTVIGGTAEMVMAQLPADSELREEVQTIKRASDRGARLTRQLLAFSRQQVLEVRVLDLNQVVHDVMALVTRVIGEHITILVQPGGNLWRMMGDAGQLEQVLMNLSVNARDAMPDGGTLTISTENVQLDAEAARHVTVRPGEYVALYVSDTGHGMDAATRERIFEPFFTTKPSGKGTGLGLPTAYGIVRQIGGSIWVYSEPGRGTTFKLFFPRVDGDIVERPSGPTRLSAVNAADVPIVRAEGLATHTPVAGGPLVVRGETVLVVEDEDAIRRVAVRVLSKAGYRVLEAESGDAAMALMSAPDAPRVDLLVTDMVMPGMTGPELAAALDERLPGLRVLFTSGYSRDAVAQQFGLQGGHFISKPYGLEALERAVRAVLDGH